ncbi:hypothetical protein EW146_g9980, partial [Bondarzewia mesenterica]
MQPPTTPNSPAPVDTPKRESDLLHSIRTALRGDDSEPRAIHRIKYAASDDDDDASEGIVYELSWNSWKVVLCAGGIILKQWSFMHEGEP